MRTLALLFVLVSFPLPALAQDAAEPASIEEEESETEAWMRERFRVDLGMTFSRFEQQVKSEIGGETGDPIVSETSFGLTLFATATIWKFIRAGVFMQLDAGSRSAATFRRIGSDGVPRITEAVGGRFVEFWLGPLIRLQWRQIFAEIGWGAIGVRSDQAREDLSAGGSTDGAFRTTPSVAWLFAVGGHVPIVNSWELVIRLEYRVRYYTRRGGLSLDGDLAHGTQNITPFVGVGYHL